MKATFVGYSLFVISMSPLLKGTPCCPPLEPTKYKVCLLKRSPLPHAGPRVFEGDNTFITADFLLWNIKEQGLDLGLSSANQSLGSVSSKGSIHHNAGGWTPGFKVGIGKSLSHDGWDLHLQNTWLEKKDFIKTARFSGNPVLYDSYWFVNNQRNGISQTYLEGQQQWDFNFNSLQLDLGRSLYLTARMSIRPYIGLQSVWQTQKLQTSFLGLSGSVKAQQELQNWGFGLRGGVNSSWHLNRHFSVITHFGVSGICEQFKIRRKDLNESDLISLSIRDSVTDMVNVWEYGIGIQHDFWDCKERYHLGFSLSWDAQTWSDQNRFLKTQHQSASYGDLSFTGVTLKTRFDF
ncbi:MAG: Lpg1974 family pore-forming outer membrane protein [Rhabdochlamydiaceae bacterium]